MTSTNPQHQFDRLASHSLFLIDNYRDFNFGARSILPPDTDEVLYSLSGGGAGFASQIPLQDLFSNE